MRNQKGQIQIILLLIAIIGVVLFFRFYKPSSENSPSTVPSVQPGQGTQSLTPKTPNLPLVNDTSAPSRSNPQPSGSLFSGVGKFYISLNTDENATCRYSDASGVFYEYMQHFFSNTGGTFHTVLITALNDGAFYNFFVRCVDERGNKNTDDFLISFYVSQPADYTPPVISNAYPKGEVLPYATTQTMIGVSTNEPASCRYSLTQGTSYDSMTSSLSAADGTQKYHTATVSNLWAGQLYNYFVRCKDAAGNANTGDVMISFQVMP